VQVSGYCVWKSRLGARACWVAVLPADAGALCKRRSVVARALWHTCIRVTQCKPCNSPVHPLTSLVCRQLMQLWPSPCLRQHRWVDVLHFDPGELHVDWQKCCSQHLLKSIDIVWVVF